MIKFIAPRLRFNECRNDREREYLEAFNRRAEQGSYWMDGWRSNDRIVLSVCLCDNDPAYNCVLRSLRIDFDDQGVAFGPDETHQFVTDLDPLRPEVGFVASQADRTPTELADVAADWLEREMQRVILRNEWIRPEFTRKLWVLADTGEELAISDSENKGRRPKLGPPDRSTKVLT